jgi:hypothetical protein
MKLNREEIRTDARECEKEAIGVQRLTRRQADTVISIANTVNTVF